MGERKAAFSAPRGQVGASSPRQPFSCHCTGGRRSRVLIWSDWIVLGHAYKLFKHRDQSCCHEVWIFRQYLEGLRMQEPSPVLLLLFRDSKVSLQQSCELCRGSSDDGQTGLQGCHFLGLPRRGSPPPAVCCHSCSCSYRRAGMSGGRLPHPHGGRRFSAVGRVQRCYFRSLCTSPCCNVREFCWENMHPWAQERW